MGPMREALEASLTAAFELGVCDEEEHAAVIEGARRTAEELDLLPERGVASLLSAYLNYCKALGLVPAAQQPQAQVVGDGRLAKMRAKSRAGLKAV